MSRISKDKFVAHITERYIEAEKTRSDIVNVYNDLRSMLRSYWDCDMLSISDYDALNKINAQLYGYFYEVAIFRAGN